MYLLFLEHTQLQKIESTRKGMDSPFRPDQVELLSIAQSLGFKIEKSRYK